MNYQYENQQYGRQLLNIVDHGTIEQLFIFLQGFHRIPFHNLTDVISYEGVIDDQIDFIDCTGTRYDVTPLIIAAGKGSYEKTKILLVHGANPNKQCATGDTALNLAVHRHKFPIVDLLLHYRANPNLYNHSGKTALHRAAVSYANEDLRHLRALLDAGADPNIEDRNQRLPLDEAIIMNKPEIVEIFLIYDPALIHRAYRAAAIASRLGYDECLLTLLNYGMDPNITDQTRTTPLHIAVRATKLSTVQLLVAHGADQNLSNNRGETPLSIAEFLPLDQQQNFINVLIETPQAIPSKLQTYATDTENFVPNIYPLLSNQSNWTFDNNEYRSQTAENSSVLNLLDDSNEKYWCCTQSKNAWIIFDLKYEHHINGLRITGCGNYSAPRNGYLDVSNSVSGPWLKVTNFTCLISQGNTMEIFFPSLETRFLRVFILDNYGGDDIQIQNVTFFGVDMRLVHLIREYGLENSLNTLLANGINDLKKLAENLDEILNSSDKYLHVNDHFQFIRLTESLKSLQLTFLEWCIPPQTTAIVGEKLKTFSVEGNSGVTDRVKLEEKLENNSQINTALVKDLEPIHSRSLADFSDYIIKYPGRHKIRIASVQNSHIHTSWQEIVVGKKPLEITVRTTAGPYLYTSGIIPPRPHSSPTTDKTDDIIEKESFVKQQTLFHTPDSYFYNSRDNNEEQQQEKNVAAMHNVRKHNQSAKESATKPVRDHGTQSEVTKRTIGTMCGPVAIRHFNNETESQPPPPPTTTQISSSRHQQQSPQRSLHDIERDYQRHETQYRPQTPRRNTRADDKHDEEQLSPSFERQRPPSRYDTNTNTRLPPAANQSEDLTSNRHPQPSSTSKDDQCGPAQSYDNHSPSSFSTSNNYSSKKKHQPAKTSVETDTRYDGMKPQRDQGVQSETRSVRHNGTSTNTEEKPRHPDPLNRPTRPVVVKPQDDCILLTCDPPRPKPGVIPLHPEKNDGYVGNYDPVDNGKGSNNQSNTSTIYGDKIYSDQKPKPTIVPLSYGHQHKTPPMRESPTLNIGTENFIRESPDNEFTTPLERDYIEDPNRSFHIDNRNDPTSHKKRVVLLRVLNSAQTYVFEQQPSSNKNVHQSRTNKNFLLASSPTMQSFNSPARIHDSRTNQTSSNDFTGRHLASQNA